MALRIGPDHAERPRTNRVGEREAKLSGLYACTSAARVVPECGMFSPSSYSWVGSRRGRLGTTCSAATRTEGPQIVARKKKNGHLARPRDWSVCSDACVTVATPTEILGTVQNRSGIPVSAILRLDRCASHVSLLSTLQSGLRLSRTYCLGTGEDRDRVAPLFPRDWKILGEAYEKRARLPFDGATTGQRQASSRCRQ